MVIAVGGLSLPSSVPAARAAGSVSSSLSLTAPASGVYGSTIKLTGMLWRTGTSTKLPNTLVYLQRSVRGQNKFGNLTTTRTSSTGTYAFSIRQAYAYEYRTYFAGSPTYRPAYSPVRYPVTNRYLGFSSIATIDAESGQLRATGQAIPAPPAGTPVYLQRYSPESKTWAYLASGRTVTDGKVTVEAKQPGSIGSYRLAIGGLWPYGTGISATRRFAHYVWRGAFTKPAQVTGDGTFTLSTPTQDPRRYAFYAEQTVKDGVLRIYPAAAGCKQARSYTSNRVTGGPTNIILTGSISLSPTQQLNESGQLGTAAGAGLSLATPANPDHDFSNGSLKHSLHLEGSSNALFGTLELRCAN
ncbi:hypothetical protein [Kribbella deserti]|uniref:Carboxypeptidase regulatory-like domain-containing protein n=1 Tax=Kribbella deserti TaxID=1926257 RepID=A0ABV6QPB0_9ACTN